MAVLADFWTWLVSLRWWEYLLIAYACGSGAILPSFADWVRDEAEHDAQLEEAEPSVLALVALILAALWPALALRRPFWKFILCGVPPGRR